MRAILPILAAVLTGGCAGAMRGPDTCADIHFDSTYVLARWAGWSDAEALTIAASNFWTDKHGGTNSVATEWRLLGAVVNPATIPWILCTGVADMVVEGESPSRAFGRRVAETTAWAVPSLGHSLHFPAVGLNSPTLPAFWINPVSGEIEYGNAEARRVLERAFLNFLSHDEDLEAALAMLGIGLHALQDSFKHGGYTAARGHIGADPDPDRACCDLNVTMLSAEVTLNSLRYARKLLTGSSSAPPKDWKSILRRAYSTPDRSPLDASREGLLERWRRARGEEGFDRALERVKEALE